MSFDDIENGVIEQRNQTGYSNHGQRLGTKNTEDDASQGGGEERFIDTVETAGPQVHVKDECKGWKHTKGFKVPYQYQHQIDEFDRS